MSFLTFLTLFTFPSLFFFGLPCVFYACAVEPLHVWARFFCLPLLPLSRLRAQGIRKWPKMTCALMLWRRSEIVVLQKKKQTKKREKFSLALLYLTSVSWKASTERRTSALPEIRRLTLERNSRFLKCTCLLLSSCCYVHFLLEVYFQLASQQVFVSCHFE